MWVWVGVCVRACVRVCVLACVRVRVRVRVCVCVCVCFRERVLSFDGRGPSAATPARQRKDTRAVRKGYVPACIPGIQIAGKGFTARKHVRHVHGVCCVPRVQTAVKRLDTPPDNVFFGGVDHREGYTQSASTWDTLRSTPLGKRNTKNQTKYFQTHIRRGSRHGRGP